MSALLKLQQEFSQAAARLIAYAAVLGYNVTLGEAFRTPEQAEWDLDHGTGIKDSVHCQRLAIDLQLFKADDTYIEDSEGYDELGKWWKSLGEHYCWGGDFERADYDHFSITPDGVHK